MQNKSGTQTSRNEAPEAAGDCSAGRLRVKSIHYKRHRTNNVWHCAKFVSGLLAGPGLGSSATTDPSSKGPAGDVHRERESLLVQYVSGCVCVGGRVCGACQWLSPSASASERTSASAAKYATLLAFGRRCGKKPPKAPHPQTKHKFGKRRNSCQGCQCCPPRQRNDTRRIGNVHGTGTDVCSVPGYYFVLYIIADYACCTPAAAKVGIQIRSLCDLLFFPRKFKLSLRKIVVPCSKNVNNTLGAAECKGSACSGNRYALEIKLGDKVP